MTEKQKWNTALLVIWLIVGGFDAMSAFIGYRPYWPQVFCPLIALLIELIRNYRDDQENPL